MTALNNISRTLLKLTLPVFVLSLYACASKPPPSNDYGSDEPVIVGSENVAEPYEPPVSQINEPYEPEPAMEPATDMAMNEESSGIVPPAEDTTMMEPPAETIMEEPAMQEPVMASAINATPADHFAVQIVAASSADNLIAFANKHGLSADLTTQITVNGKEWHVLLLGTYQTLAEAKEALAGVEGRFNTSPWIRKVGSLQ